MWCTDPDRSPTTLAATEIRLRRPVRPFFGDRPIEAVRPILIRQWQNQLPARLGDEPMGHQRSRHGELDGGSRIGARYRHTTAEMAARVVDAIEARLAVVGCRENLLHHTRGRPAGGRLRRPSSAGGMPRRLERG